jgi:hypothetical protein
VFRTVVNGEMSLRRLKLSIYEVVTSREEEEEEEEGEEEEEDDDDDFGIHCKVF